jgi:hypothetical protein
VARQHRRQQEQPDPNQWVGWGDRTVDEMAHAWVNVTYMSDEDYEKEVAARQSENRQREQRRPQVVSRCDRPCVCVQRSSAGVVALGSQGTAQLPLDPRHDTGQSITPAYEGWYKNADGSFTLLVGYYNRNSNRRSTFRSDPTNALSRRTRPGTADALPAAAPVGRVHHSRAG